MDPLDPHSPIPAPDTDLLAGWLSVRASAAAAEWTLNGSILAQLSDLFLSYYSGERTPVELTREYASPEFLLPLDGQGTAASLPAEDFQRASLLLDTRPGFRRWFQAAETGDGASVLLAERWLCHMVGLRHATVEIFIDPPDRVGHTLVQIRSLDKVEAPGAFDMPCAGHVSGMDAAEAALGKELAEELSLSLDALGGLEKICCYESQTGAVTSVTNLYGLVNIEYRTLYCAKIKPDKVSGIRFSDGEVAGLAIFSVAELQALIEKYPERIASGLAGAMRYYPGVSG